MFQAMLSTFLWLALAPAGCGGCGIGSTNSFTYRQSASQDVPADTVITLIRTACYGFCPAYSLTISADGRVLYNGHQEVKQKGKLEGRISPEKVKELIAAFKQINYFDLMDRYVNGDVCSQWLTDMPSAITSLTLNGKKKTVNHYYGCLGSKDVGKLMWLEKKIDETVNSDQWVKELPKL